MIDFMGSRMVQILPFEIDLGTTVLFGKCFCMKNGAGPADIMLVQISQLLMKGFVFTDLFIGIRDFL
jgi:hypothetical protein